MKKLLSIVICVIIPATAAAWTYKYYAQCHVYEQQNRGEIYVGQEDKSFTWCKNYDCTGSSGNVNDWGIFGSAPTSASKNFWMAAKAYEGYYHAGWIKGTADGPGTQIEAGSETGETRWQISVTTSATSEATRVQVHYYAIFEKQAIYRDFVQVKAIYRDISGNVETDPNTGNPVLGGGVVSVDDAIDANSTSTDVAGTNTLIRGGKATNKFSYTYHAQADNNFVFKGWSESPTGIPLLSETNTTITKEWETATNDENNPYVAPVLYAVFQQEFTYYYTGATAYVAGETEGGEIRVSYDGGASYTDFASSIQDNGLKSQLI